jgi:hypothetical protein
LQAGVRRAVIGSAAVEDPQLLRDCLIAFGHDRVCLAIDVRGDATGVPRVRTRGRRAGQVRRECWGPAGRIDPARGLIGPRRRRASIPAYRLRSVRARFVTASKAFGSTIREGVRCLSELPAASRCP